MTSRAGGSDDPGSFGPREHSDETKGSSQARSLLLRAAEALLAEREPRDITVAALCSRAHTSEGEFGRLFADRADCLFALYDQLEERQASLIANAYRAHESWQDGLRAALLHGLGTLQRNPALARILVLPAPDEEPALTVRRARTRDRLARALESALPESPASIDSHAVVGTAAAVVRGRLLEAPDPDLIALCGPLMAMIVMPYLGADASSRELASGAG